MSVPGDEPVEVVDESDRVVDIVPRRVMRERKLLHRCTYVVVLDENRRVYVHRRTPTKDMYPSFHDMTAGGVNAVGETYKASAAREISEELGVTAAPTFRFMHRYEGSDGRCWGAVFDVVWDGEIRWQPEEIVSGEFVALADIPAMTERERFCPDGLEAFERWRREVDQRPS